MIAPEPLRGELLRRGEWFADRAWHDLEEFDTRYSARACAVLMIEGLIDGAFRSKHDLSCLPPAPKCDFGHPEDFQSQATRAKQQIRSFKGLARASLAALRPRNLSILSKHLLGRF